MSLRGARKIFQTARSILKRDPVAHSLLEVLLTYPGIRVLFWYRIAHFMAFHRLYKIAMIEDDVTILHGVTLGVRRAVEGRRHP